MIGGMISRLAPATRRYLPRLAFWMLLAMPLAVPAGELMPFEIPEEEIQWDQVELNEFNASLPILDRELPPKPVDNRPDWPAPAIDAYLDTSFSQSDFNELGFSDSSGGYRFIAGFRMDTPALGLWSVAAEFGYNRIGRAERSVVTVDDSSPQFTKTQTDTYKTDLSSLDFGTRIGYRISPLLELYGRGGMQFYHVANKNQTRLDFTPKNNNPNPPTSGPLPPSSLSRAKANVFGTGGIALKLGKVPYVYAEYGARNISGKLVSAGSVGVLMNF